MQYECLSNYDAIVPATFLSVNDTKGLLGKDGALDAARTGAAGQWE
ncbi:hypothetical protein [Spongorhabdus nitratireducens]